MSSFPPPTTAPAGWYPDPAGGSALRYFDGLVWAPAEAQRPSPIPMRSAVWVMVALVASLIMARLSANLMVGLGVPSVLAFTVLTVVAYGPALCAVILVMRAAPGRAETVGMRPRWSDLLFGPVVWIAVLVAQVVTGIALVVFGIPVQSNVEDLSENRPGWAVIAVLLVSAVVVAPVVEELVFRGVILQALSSRAPTAVAILLQGLAFGLIHLGPELGTGAVGLVIVLSVIGVILGVSVILLGRIWPAILAHAIFNAVVLAVVLSGVLDRLN